MLPQVYATSLKSGSVINTTLTNSSITFNTYNITTTNVRVENDSITLTNVICSNGAEATTVFHNITNQNNDSSTFCINIPPPAPTVTGGGGGGLSQFIFGDTIEDTDVFLCNETYNYIIKNGQTNDELITSLIYDINLRTNKTYQYEKVNRYVDNWQLICSTAIGISLQEDFVCEKVSVLINKKTAILTSDIVNLQEEISQTIPISLPLLDSYIKDFNNKCRIEIKEKPLLDIIKKSSPLLIIMSIVIIMLVIFIYLNKKRVNLLFKHNFKKKLNSVNTTENG